MNRIYPLLLLCGVLWFLPRLSAQQLVSVESLGGLSRQEMADRYNGFIAFGVRHYKITYSTHDIAGRPDTASGLIVVPDDPTRIFPLLCYQHGTSSTRADVPSNLRGTYEIAEASAGFGYLTVAPDYLGLGESRGIHPYVHAASEAWAAIDMLFAARQFALQEGIPLNGQLFITGYSQGGHAAAALQRELEANYADVFPVTASTPMSGPYSISGEMRRLILSDEPYYSPVYLPFVILSYNRVYDLYDDLSAVFKEPFATMIREYVDSDQLQGNLNGRLIDSLTAYFGGPFPRRMLQDSLVENFIQNPDHPFAVALRDNDVYDWAPQAPTRLYYCTADDQVPYRNSIVADSVMNARGGRDVQAVKISDVLNHVQCAEPAVTAGLFFFLQYQQVGTGVGSIAGKRVALYPNPVGDQLTVEAPDGALLEVLDLQGRLRLRQLVREMPQPIAVGHLPAGVYVVHIRSQAGVWTGKVVKE